MTPPRYLGSRDPAAGTERLPIRLMGPVSMVIAASTVFCLTCLFYLWQDSEITTGTARVAQLRDQLVQVSQTNETLSAQASKLQSLARIETEASTKYGMLPVQSDRVLWVPSSVLQPVLAANRPAAPSRPAAPLARRPAARAPQTAWWQAASHALAALFR